MESALVGTAAAFGLASAAGLNTTLPLFLVGLSARLGLIVLVPPYDALASDLALAGLAFLAIAEIVGDKIPAADSLVHAIQWPLTLAAGAILFASQHSIIRDISPGAAVIVGVLAAGGIHGLRALVRPAVNVGTMGLGGPLVSGLEDFASIGLTVTSLFVPVLALLMLALIVGMGIKVVQRVRASRAGVSSNSGT